ncbi:alpha/beta hydrolase [Zhongshania aliphaticivorans]|uniref:alpha/beta hydrolase n=1 Tax=Zhongshania aliphaticivorans TaxID=1470434 RepID=UPI00132F59C3|nr:alpha/beta hydrolase [Zhongshania aliphaticivorans]
MINWSPELDPASLPSLSDIGMTAGIDGVPWAQEYSHYYDINFEEVYPGLRHLFGAFTSVGERIAMQVFMLPDAHSTAFVYHGYYDHVGLFNNVINYFLKHGYSVVAYDLPGHGLSTGERAAIDDFMRYRQVLNDAFTVVADFGLPERKVGLAQSTGCAVLMSHLLSGGEHDFDRVVLLAPLLKPCDWWWGKPAHSVLKYFIHSLPRKFADNSDDQHFLAFLRERDPLQARSLPLSWVGALKKWQPWFLRQPPVASSLLILQGDQDETVEWRYNLPRIQAKFPNAGVVHIPGARHHLAKEGERFREQLWQACDDYL